MSGGESAVEDNEILLRTDFAPEHIINGQLVAAGIRADDLTDRGFSVDRESMADIFAIESRLSAQMEKCPEKRRDPYIAPFVCGPVRSHILEQDGNQAFIVVHKPENDNTAHTHLYSAVKRSKSLIKALKGVLLPQLNAQICSLEHYKAGQRDRASSPNSEVSIN